MDTKLTATGLTILVNDVGDMLVFRGKRSEVEEYIEWYNNKNEDDDLAIYAESIFMLEPERTYHQ